MPVRLSPDLLEKTPAKRSSSLPETRPLSPDLLEKMDAYWRAANYLTVGQIYLQDNPLLETPLKLEHIKPRLLGHWGTTTGINFHLCPSEPADQRARSEHDLCHRSGSWRPGPGGT